MERLPFYLFFICAGFLSGSIAYSYFLPKLLLHKNILLLSDDGNPGCANVFKYIGVPMGILCLLCDFFKGICLLCGPCIFWRKEAFCFLLSWPLLQPATCSARFYIFTEGKRSTFHLAVWLRFYRHMQRSGGW